MKLPTIKFSKKYFLTFLLILLLGWSTLSQTIFLSDFDKAKAAAAHWPQFSYPHLQLAVALFNTGSLASQKELKQGKIGLFTNREVVAQTEKVVMQPKMIETDIDFWKAFVEKNIQLPQAYLNLAWLNFKLYRDQQAKEYWQKAFWLDPNNKTIEELGEIIGK